MHFGRFQRACSSIYWFYLLLCGGISSLSLSALELEPGNVENTYSVIKDNAVFGLGYVVDSSSISIYPNDKEKIVSEDWSSSSFLLRYKWATIHASSSFFDLFGTEPARFFSLRLTPISHWVFQADLYGYRGFTRIKPDDDSFSKIPKSSPDTTFMGGEVRASYLWRNTLSWESAFGITERQKENAWSWVLSGLFTYNQLKNLDHLFSSSSGVSQSDGQNEVKMASLVGLGGIAGVATWGNSTGSPENPFFISGLVSFGYGVQQEQHRYLQQDARTQYYITPQGLTEVALGWKPYPFYLIVRGTQKSEASVASKDLSYVKTMSSLELGWLF